MMKLNAKLVGAFLVLVLAAVSLLVQFNGSFRKDGIQVRMPYSGRGSNALAVERLCQIIQKKPDFNHIEIFFDDSDVSVIKYDRGKKTLDYVKGDSQSMCQMYSYEDVTDAEVFAAFKKKSGPETLGDLGHKVKVTPMAGYCESH